MNYYPQKDDLTRYREYDALSQTFLKKVLSNDSRPFKETLPILLGSYTDALLTTNFADELFQKGLEKRPSEAITQIINSVFENLLSVDSPENIGFFEDYKELLLMGARKANYHSKRGDDALWNALKEDGKAYWQELIESQGKTIITREEHELCSTIAALTLSSEITGRYFIEQKNVEKHFQKDIYWKWKDEPCKGLLDILIIEPETKSIYIVDIKFTTVSFEQWFSVARQKQYPFQMSFYKEGVEFNYKDLIDEGYTVKCRWMVLPKNTQRFRPWIIPCTELMLDSARYGYLKHKSKYIIGQNAIEQTVEYPGWEKAIEMYKECKKNLLIDYDLTYFKSKGKLNDLESNNYFFR